MSKGCLKMSSLVQAVRETVMLLMIMMIMVMIMNMVMMNKSARGGGR